MMTFAIKDLPLPAPAKIIEFDYHASSADTGATIALTLLTPQLPQWSISLLCTGIRELSIHKVAADGISCALFEVTEIHPTQWKDIHWMVGDFKTDAITFYAEGVEVISADEQN